MALLQCEMCGGELEISPDKSIGVCTYCGSTFTIPKEIEKKGNLFNRANYLRQNCNFDKAISVYESILADNCEDADALWGLVLCRYGIEFVEDPKTKTRIPTCHRTSRTSILIDPDFKLAVKYADEEKREVYYEHAAKIDQVQKAILSMSDTQEKYDVFICYKESDDNGDRTIDSVLAQELYNELTKMKIKTFFSRKTLESKGGSEYEPIIYSALNSAKVMIVLGTKPEYFEATWVKNEWNRYLDFMNDGDDKHLIPVYRDMSAYQLPEEFMSIQAFDMSRIGFMIDLCDGIKKILRKDDVKEEPTNAPISKDNLYSRAMVFLGNREFYKAVDYFEKVLDLDPKYSRAYWGSVLASYKCVTNNELVNCNPEDWTEDVRVKNALQFAGVEEKKIYDDTISRRVANLKNLASKSFGEKDFEKCIFWCDRYINYDSKDGGVWWIRLLAKNKASDSNELFDNCLKNEISIINSKEYQNAISYSISEEVSMYEKIANKIEIAVNEKKRKTTYEKCKSHMMDTVDSLEQERRDEVSNSWRIYEKEISAVEQFNKENGKFYQNNIFSFILQTLIWAVPSFLAVYFIVKYIENYTGNTANLWAVFGITFGSLIALIALVKFFKYIFKSEKSLRLANVCNKISKNLESSKKDIAFSIEREKKAKEMLEEYLVHPDLTVEEIETIRNEFDLI